MNLRRYALLRAELQRTQDLVLGQLLDQHAAAELHLLLLAADGGAAAGAAELLCCDAYRVAELTEALGLAIASRGYGYGQVGCGRVRSGEGPR